MDKIKQTISELGLKTVFSQNAKMKRSSQNGIHLYNFGIPAYKDSKGNLTCPNASKCIKGCYAKQGAYVWTNVANAYETRLKLTQHINFIPVIKHYIDKLLAKHKTGTVYIRVHDSGDFYSPLYQSLWYSVANSYSSNERIKFYAYTKMVSQSKTYKVVPSNFSLIYSFGGREDNLINVESDRHSKVFETELELSKAGYKDASHNDIDALGVSNKIGLVYHGTKSYKNTTWSKV